jgi:hypothetical protein
MKNIICSLLISLSGFTITTAKAQAVIDLESGLVFSGYNNVRIPGDQGTLFSLSEDLQASPQIFYRLRAGYTINSRHTILALYAPLETRYEGSVEKDILFQGVLFPANSPLTGTYKFNSYRLTYRYELVNTGNLLFGLGLTAKIRDARIALSSPTLSAEKTNVGFVPIINFRLFWKVDENWGLLLDGDALAAPQGRAEDVLIALTYKVSDNFTIRTGYRILEGGADNAEVYNFTLFHYASIGLSYTFGNRTQ